MNCPKCGNELKPNMKFCAKCGTAVPQQPAAPIALQLQKPAEPMKEFAQPTPSVPAQNSVDTKPAKQKRAEKSGKKNIALRVIAIILVIAVLLGGGLFATDAILFKTESEKDDYITDFPILKQNTELLVYDAEKFPYDDYNIKVDRFKMGKVFKSSSFSSFENVINERSNSKIFNIDFEEDGKYQIILTGIVSERTQIVPSTQPSSTTTKAIEPKIITIIVIVDDDNDEAVDKATLGSKAEDNSAESANENSIDTNNESTKSAVEYEISKLTAYKSDGSIDSWIEYEYDADGNMIKYTSYDSDGSIDSWIECEYDADGNMIKYTSYDSDGSIVNWYEREYDADGNMIKYTSYDSDGSIVDWYECEYDANGNKIKETHYHSDGSIGHWYKYEYDANGNKIKYTIYNSDGSIVYWNWYEREYDANGNPIKETCYDSNGSIDEWNEYEYDANGNPIKETCYDSDGSIDEWIECEYDANGNEMKVTSYNSDGSIDGYIEYEYIAIKN